MHVPIHTFFFKARLNFNSSWVPASQNYLLQVSVQALPGWLVASVFAGGSCRPAKGMHPSFLTHLACSAFAERKEKGVGMQNRNSGLPSTSTSAFVRISETLPWARFLHGHETATRRSSKPQDEERNTALDLSTLARAEYFIWAGLCWHALCITSRNQSLLFRSDPTTFCLSAQVHFTTAARRAVPFLSTAFQQFPSCLAAQMQLGSVPPTNSYPLPEGWKNPAPAPFFVWQISRGATLWLLRSPSTGTVATATAEPNPENIISIPMALATDTTKLKEVSCYLPEFYAGATKHVQAWPQALALSMCPSGHVRAPERSESQPPVTSAPDVSPN